jgi:hypothetical protein
LDVDDGVADGEGDLDREQCADEVEDRGNVTAPLGESAPVAIDAAMAFPVSWKPLVKSKARATTTTRPRMMVAVVTGSWWASQPRRARVG